MAIARLVRAAADPSRLSRLDADSADLVSALEAGIACRAAVTHGSQIRFAPRDRRLDDPVPRGSRHGLQVAVTFQFVEVSASAALTFAIEATRVARAAAMAQTVIDIAAAGGTVPADVDFAQLLEIRPEGAAARLHSLSAAHAAGDTRSTMTIDSERAKVDPSLVQLATKLSDTYCHAVGMTGVAWKDLAEAERNADLTAIAAVRNMIWSERADVLAKVVEMSTLAHEIATSAFARRMADQTASSEVRARLLAEEMTSDQVASKASQIFGLAAVVLAGAGAEGASITPCRLPADGGEPYVFPPCRQCGTPEGGQRPDLRTDWRCSACGATGSGQ